MSEEANKPEWQVIGQLVSSIQVEQRRTRRWGIFFKSIVLFNADKLTIDAQSALRRCIEQFSHTTRFFIVVEEQSKLLKPIVSRFCNI